MFVFILMYFYLQIIAEYLYLSRVIRFMFDDYRKVILVFYIIRVALINKAILVIFQS